MSIYTNKIVQKKKGFQNILIIIVMIKDKDFINLLG